MGLSKKTSAAEVSRRLSRHRGDGLPHLPHARLMPHGLPAETAYELISSELLLDGAARLNLATFVTTWMPPHAER
ncbi:MAG: hypothetical protein J0H43_11010, partial [Actinobacteria bacterium]|nr:hypothetical protein [Actinomycetota bacterium]